MPELSDDETARIAHKLADRLAERKQEHWIEGEVHYLDHRWIQHRRESEKETKDMKSKIIQSATVWALILVLGYMCKAVWKTFVTTVKTGM